MMRAPLLLPLLIAAALLALPAAPGVCEGDAAQPARGRHLDLSVDRYKHDFGAVKQNDVRSTEFTYTNTTDHVVKGISARGECGCNRVEVSASELDPGKSGTLRVEFNTLTLGGRLHKRVHLRTTDYKRGEALIELDIAIVAGLVVRPPGLSFKEVQAGTHPSKAFFVRWYEGLSEPFEITEVSVPGYEDLFAIAVTAEAHPKDPKWRGWRIELTLQKTLPLGMFSAEVLVRTTDKERPRLTMPLSANVHGRIWMQSRKLSFGAVRYGKGRSASIKFRPFDKSVTFGEVRAKARKGLIQVEVKPDPFLAKDGYWKLIGTVPADAEPGSLEDEVIELYTGVPGEEITEIEVLGLVRRPR